MNGRNLISWEQKLDMDIWYVENRSFRLDLRILIMTAMQMLRRHGISAAGHETMPEFRGTTLGTDHEPGKPGSS